MASAGSTTDHNRESRSKVYCGNVSIFFLSTDQAITKPESTKKIIQTSIDKSKLDTIYKENLKDIKNSLKKSTTI